VPPPAPEPTPPPDPPRARVEFKGRVSGLSGSCPSLQFNAEVYEVVTNDDTRFTGGNCRDLRNGMEVEVTGDVLRNGVAEARRVELKKK
jgi:hypothetical protein